MNLFKYCPPERIDILKNLRVRFTQPSHLNDPFEGKPYFQSVLLKDKFLGKMRANIDRDYYKQLILNQFFEKKKIFLKENPDFIFPYSDEDAYFLTKNYISNNYDKITNENWENFNKTSIKNITDNFINMMGILSLSENYDNLLMWSHYTNSFKGFVIEFDASNPWFNYKSEYFDRLNTLRKVEYTTKRPIFKGHDFDLPDESLISLVNACFIKSKHWEYENEWRFLLPLNDGSQSPNDSNIYLFSFPAKMIKTVYIGVNADNNTSGQLVELSQEHGFNIVKTKLSDSDFNLTYDN